MQRRKKKKNLDELLTEIFLGLTASESPINNYVRTARELPGQGCRELQAKKLLEIVMPVNCRVAAPCSTVSAASRYYVIPIPTAVPRNYLI